MRKAVLASFLLILSGCVSPEQQRMEEQRRSSLTPYQKCIESAERSDAWCKVGCAGLLMSRLAHEQEQGRQCQARCEITKNVAFNSCSAYR